MNLLNIEHISKIYGEKIIFDDASFGVQEGDKIGIVGINGTGKTTLLRMIAGTEVPDDGQIIRQNGMKIAHLTQNPVFPEGATILSYVQSVAEDMEWRVQSNLNTLGITDHTMKIEHLSGGQKRRVAMAKVLAEDFDLLLLDEAGSAWELDMVDKELLQSAVLHRPDGQECVLTAHAAPQWMLDAADYSTEMKCCRHPYQKGIAARQGIEY